MVFQVSNVVRHHEFERHWIVPADPDWIPAAILRGPFHQVQQMAVVGEPKRDEIGPRPILIVLRGDPGFLRISNHRKLILKLCSYEPVVIVGGRIEEVAEDFLA